MGKKLNVTDMDWPNNLMDAIGISSEDPLDHLGDIGTMEVAMCLSRLTDREKRVLRMRYMQQMTLKDVGTEIGVQQERVRQIEAKALRKMRNPYDAGGVILRIGVKGYIGKLVEELATAAIAERQKALEIEYRAKLEGLNTKTVEEIKSQNRLEALTMEIVELDLSVRAFNCLTRSGCNTVADVITRYPKYEDACKIRNLGRRSMEEISDKLLNYGIKWPEDGMPATYYCSRR